MTAGIIIVGGGQAGIQIADSLRAEGFEGSIDVFASEPHLPYQRPPLSKDFMGTEEDATALPLRAEKFFADRSVTFHPSVVVSDVDAEVRTVTTEAGETYPYTDLVLATGARNRTLRIPGAELAGVHSLRTLDDAMGLREELGAAARALVIGAGFIGLEFAASARLRGVNVTVLEMAPRMMGRVLSQPMSEHFFQVHTASGIETHLSEGIAELRGENGRVTAGVGTSGVVYPADLVVVGVGVIPNTDLAEKAGVEVANGIVVNEYLRTSDPHIWALGDCANYPDARTGDMIRLESVQNAVDQGKTLAKTLAGTPTPYTEWPWFWSSQGPHRLQIAGRIDPGDETVVRGDAANGAFSVFCFRDGAFVGAESVNSTGDHLAARRILDRGLPLTADQAADPTFGLKAYSKQAVPA